MRTPIQIIVLRDSDEPKATDYVNALRLAFEGTVPNLPTTYLEDSVDLGIHVIVPENPENELLNFDPIIDAAAHSVGVVLKSDRRTKTFDRNVRKLNKLLGKPCMLVEQIPGNVTEGEIQKMATGRNEIEPALRPSVTALKAMQRARNLLQTSLFGDAAPLKFFLSHAKLDGIPSALSLLSLLKSLEFEKFYDVEDIHPGDSWRDVLESNAANSVLIALRTEEYESRYWCQREYQLAEESGMPIIVVDLRIGQSFAPSRLPLETAPTVRLHDGNLIRVILQAQACHLRVLRLRCMIKSLKLKGDCELLPQLPSEISLHGALQRLGKGDSTKAKGRIIYPSPKGTTRYLEAVNDYMKSGGRNVSLTTIDDLH